MNKSMSQVAWSAVIIAPALLLFVIVADMPHVLLVTAGGYALSFMRRKQIIWTDRTIIYTLVIIAVTVVMLDMVFPFNRDRFGYVTMLIQPQFYTVGAFYLAVALTFFNTGKSMIGGAAAVAIFSLIASADVFNFNIPSVRLPFVEAVVNTHFYNFYVWTMCIEITLILIAFRHTVPLPVASRKSLGTKWVVMAIMWIALPLLIYGGFKLYRHFESELRRWENMLIRMSSRQTWRRGRTAVFSKETNLHRIMSPEVLASQQQIILRSIGPNPPGYMRGRVYEEYMNGIWKETADQKATESLAGKTYGGMITYKSFFIRPEKAEYKYEYQIYQDANFVSDVLLVPGAVKRLDAIADHVTLSENGIVKLEDWQKDGGYTIFADAGADEAYPNPAADLPEYLLQYSPRLQQGLQEVLDAVPGLADAATDEQRFMLLLKYYQDNFTYSLSWEPNPMLDPVIHFLKNIRQGHCELYAASMTLLLRRMGIPARYVTGFICAEGHPSGKYFVARIGNAHAWLEAYDRDRKQWVMLEPTPPSEIGGAQGDWDTISDWRDRIGQSWQQLMANLRRGLFAEAIADAAVFIWEVVWFIVANPFGALLIIGFVVWYWRRRHRHRKKLSALAQSREIIALGKLYRKWADKWEKRLALPREPGRSSSELLELLRNSGQLKPEELQKAEAFILRYQQLRFSGNPVTRDDLKQLLQ